MKKTVIGVVIALIVGVGIVFAVKSLNKPKTTTPMDNMPQTSTTTTTTTTTSEKTSSVVIQNFAFSPNNITVKRGTKVTWTNQDSTGHTVTADSGDGPTSQTLQQGQSYSFTFNTAGTFKYHCQIHPNMTGTVVVQ